MTPKESELLRKLADDVESIKDRDYAGGFTAFAVFCMFFVFLANGCSFK